MKNELKISTLSIVCVLCATAVSGAWGAASVRSLGGAGTYTSASDAASAGASGAMRGGSVRVTPSTGKTTTVAKPVGSSTTTGRVATTPRLSIGKYLPGGTSISGGPSIKYPGGGGSFSSGGGTNPGLSVAVEESVAKLKSDVADLKNQYNDINDALDLKQGLLRPRQDGYVIIENDEVFVDVNGLSDALGAVGVGDVEFQVSNGEIQWRQGTGTWNLLIAIDELMGAPGEKGEKGDKGDKGDKGEPGEAGTIDTAAMNAAIDAAIATRDWSAFATAADLNKTADDLAALTVVVSSKASQADLESKAAQADLNTLSNTVRGMYTNEQIDAALSNKQAAGNYATTEQLNAKANAADVYTKTETNQAITDAVDGVVAGDLTDALKNYTTKDYVDTNLTTKADKSELSNYATTDALSGKADVSQLTTIGTAADAATVAAGVAQSDAAAAKSAAATAQTTADSAKATADAAAKNAGDALTVAQTAAAGLANVYTKTESDGKYATKSDLDDKLDAGALTGYAKTADIAGVYETQAHASETYATKSDLNAKANAADVMTADQANATYATKDALTTGLSGKQDALTFDAAPTASSQNPVMSGGVYSAIEAAKLSASDVDLSGYATTTQLNNVKELVPATVPTDNGEYILTINNGEKTWVQVEIVGLK